MATATTVSPQRTWLRKFIRFIAIVVIVLIVAAVACALYFKHVAVSSLPQLDGEISIAGLSAPVTVIRDKQGVPHIRAANLHDLLFAQGFVTAQDRLWQMDMSRRYGRGELSEVLGIGFVKIDKRQRILQIRQAAKRAAAALSTQDRAFAEAYASGVNALMQRQMDNLPIEFRVLRYKPRPWTVEDSITVGANIVQSLNSTYGIELSREKISARLTAEEAADLYPVGSARDHWPGMEVKRDAEAATLSPEQNIADHVMASISADVCEECFPGSNNWVISGMHTTTGKPLLANDMHLGHTIPNTWYEVHLKAEGYDVAGVSLPGLPFIVAGHNARLAWGFTNVGPDVQDLFIENFNPNGEYQTPAGWQKAAVSHEVIKVKSGQDVTFDVLTTRHGPVISELFPGEARKLALKWTIYDPATMQTAFHSMGEAKVWSEFRTALSHFGGAAQNVVYADVDGNIGYQTAGNIPIRTSGKGAVPVQGNVDSFEWRGYIPFEELPSVFNPPGGIIGTANARITPDSYKHLISNGWASAYRTERIYKVLSSKDKFAPDEMLKLQMDTVSEYERLCADRFATAVEKSANASERAKQAAAILRHFDGRVVPEAIAPAINAEVRRKLLRILLEPKLGALWEDYQWESTSAVIENLITAQPARWVPKGYADLNAAIAATVEKAVSDPALPKDLNRWTYGSRFPLQLQHPVFGALPVIGWQGMQSSMTNLVGPGTVPQAGSSSTVKAAGRTFGASQRFTADLSDLDRSTLNIITGQSGQPFSPHYMDQWGAWYGGSTFVLSFSDSAVDANAAHRLTLK